MTEQMSVDPQDPYAFDYILGRHLGAIKGNHTLHCLGSQIRQFQHRRYSHIFAYNAQDLLDPSSRLSQKHPQISQVFRERLGLAFSKRNNEEFSRCNCGDDSGHRCDSELFQRRNSTSYHDFIYLSAEGRTTAKAVCLCPDLKNRVQIYGFIGAGSKTTPLPSVYCLSYRLLTEYSIWCHFYCSRERRFCCFPGGP